MVMAPVGCGRGHSVSALRSVFPPLFLAISPCHGISLNLGLPCERCPCVVHVMVLLSSRCSWWISLVHSLNCGSSRAFVGRHGFSMATGDVRARKIVSCCHSFHVCSIWRRWRKHIALYPSPGQGLSFATRSEVVLVRGCCAENNHFTAREYTSLPLSWGTKLLDGPPDPKYSTISALKGHKRRVQIPSCLIPIRNHQRLFLYAFRAVKIMLSTPFFSLLLYGAPFALATPNPTASALLDLGLKALGGQQAIDAIKYVSYEASQYAAPTKNTYQWQPLLT